MDDNDSHLETQITILIIYSVHLTAYAPYTYTDVILFIFFLKCDSWQVCAEISSEYRFCFFFSLSPLFSSWQSGDETVYIKMETRHNEAEVDFDSNRVLTETDRRGLSSETLKRRRGAANTFLDLWHEKRSARPVFAQCLRR